MDPDTIILRRAERHGKIIFVSSQLYGIAKVFLEIQERSCAEVCSHPGTPAIWHIIDQAVPFLGRRFSKGYQVPHGSLRV
jgi:hypothetical protein